MFLLLTTSDPNFSKLNSCSIRLWHGNCVTATEKLWIMPENDNESVPIKLRISHYHR